jgi:hypothetical protein
MTATISFTTRNLSIATSGLEGQLDSDLTGIECLSFYEYGAGLATGIIPTLYRTSALVTEDYCVRDPMALMIDRLSSAKM